MPYINNKLLELIDQEKLSPCQSFKEHQQKIKAFKAQMREDIVDIPENAFKRNDIFLALEEILEISI